MISANSAAPAPLTNVVTSVSLPVTAIVEALETGGTKQPVFPPDVRVHDLYRATTTPARHVPRRGRPDGPTYSQVKFGGDQLPTRVIGCSHPRMARH